MSLVWHHRLSNQIQELGYDIENDTLVVNHNDGVRRTYRPVSYETYQMISRAKFPEHLIGDLIVGKVPETGHRIPVKWAP